MTLPYRVTSQIVVLATIALLGITGISFSGSGIAATDTKDSKKLKTLKHEIAELQKQLRKNDDKRSSLSSELRRTELKATDTQRVLQKLNRQIRSLNAELSALAQREEQLQLKKQGQADIVSKELSAAYRLGQSEPLKLLFNLENPDHISRMLKYYDYMVDARKQILIGYKNTLDEITVIEVSLLEKQETLAANQAQASNSAKQLAEQLVTRKTLLSTINQRFNNDQSRLKKLQLERGQLEKIIAKLEQQIQQLSIPNETPFVKQRGKLPWPVRGRIRHSYGSTRNGRLKWSGWLVEAKQSSSVKAIHYGRVVFSDYLRGQGLLLIVDHGEGYLSLYAHNQILLKETGDWVASSEGIAQVGNTGGLERSALYFEIRHRGKAVDPKRWLKPGA
ncbi:MAG: peptidoglycan DD-metalloendopeptidase family protein [Porticoccaceae bacterium]|nr:peptidoglycan DD-metalloendopeptidase family protein [Porticoccaceae bacterium]